MRGRVAPPAGGTASRTPREPVPSRLTLDEKAALTAGADMYRTAGVDRLDIPSLLLSDGPSGVRGDPRHPSPSTCLPCGTALAATWDRELVERVGTLLGDEARDKGAHVLLAPTVNLHRHPLAGRNFECFSEDPYLSAEVAARYVQGVQSRGVGCAVKHLVANDQEYDRWELSVDVDERTLHEIYLAPFEGAVRDGGAWAVMAAGNRINGVHCTEHAGLLRHVLRGEWGFDGVVISDWYGTRGTTALAAGLDLEMPARYLGRYVAAAVRQGDIREMDVDTAVARVLLLVARTRRSDAPTPSGRGSRGSSPRQDGRQLAREAAARAIVLLRNDGVLPLDGDRIGSLAVLGPKADQPDIQGGGSVEIDAHHVVTPLEGLTRRARRDRGDAVAVRHEPGVAVPTGETAGSGSSVSEADRAAARDRAVAAAADCDVAIVVVGDERPDCEGVDRRTMDLPADQVALVRAVAAVNPATVVLVNTGAPVTMDWADTVAAVAQVWYPGQEAGDALADVLFGDVDAAGRLPTTFPRQIEDTPAHPTYPGDEGRTRYVEGVFVGYRHYDTRAVEPRFGFGHGLSYTQFRYGELRLARLPAGGDGPGVEVVVDVTNVGERPGNEVVQVYVHDVDASVPRPDQELHQFARVALDPGESAAVRVVLRPRAFAFWDILRHDWVVEPGEFEIRVGSSSRAIHSTARITVT